MKKSALIIGMAFVGCMAASNALADNSGSSLSVVLDTPAVVCNAAGTGADVTTGYSVLSTGAADAASVTTSIGGVDYQLPTIASGNAASGGGWTFGGRTKTAEGEFVTFLANGDYSIAVCAAQGGNDQKSACSTPAPVTVNCESQDLCANVGAFGEVPNNKNLCKANGNIQVNFRGSFDESATLEISGPEGFSLTTDVDRAGDSCNYHYNWNPADDQIAGTYVFTVNGSLSFSADLICDTPGGNN